MYIIGLLDDQESELKKIRRTISPRNSSDISFVNYPIPNKETFVAIVNQIKDDILDEKIHSIIIDYQIFSEENFFDGAKIYQEISVSFPKFSTIILTQVIDTALKQTNIDSDKLYIKSDFFASGTDGSKRLVEKIFRNITIYLDEKHTLETKLCRLKTEISQTTNPTQEQKLIDDITCLEAKLDEYIPTGLSEIEKRLKLDDDMNKMFDLIAKAKEL